MTESETLTAESRPITTRPRLGFAGVGWIGRHRMQAIAESGFGEVAGIYDPGADAAGS
jgi:hypothetical protein